MAALLAWALGGTLWPRFWPRPHVVDYPTHHAGGAEWWWRASVRAILDIPPDRRTPAQVQTIFSDWRTTVPEWNVANDRIAELWRQHPEGSSQLALLARAEPRETHVLMRGDFLKQLVPRIENLPALVHGIVAVLDDEQYAIDIHACGTTQRLGNGFAQFDTIPLTY